MGKVVENGELGFEEMDDADYTDFEIIRHVRDALSSVLKGDSENYNELLGHLHHKKHLSPDEVAFLVTSLKALSGAVSYIDVHHHEDLLNAIFGMRLWQYAPDVMDALVELIISLAASNAKCIVECLEMLVKNFVPPFYILNAISEPFGLARKEQVLSRVHAALKDISNLVPLAPMLLSPIVIRHMPNVYSKEPVIRIYVENMLNLESGAIREVVGGKMLPALVDRMIELDVEIGWDDILQDDSSKGIFEMELKDIDDIEDDDDENKDEFQLTREFLRHSLQGNVVAEKLDSLLVQTFEHLEHCQNNNRLEEVFNVLLDSFERTVLNAYKSKFTQFVMFYACALDPEDCGMKFAQKLLEMFESDKNPPPTRMSAVAYLASYLSRGKFLSASLVVNALTRLVDWCNGYCKRHNDEANPIAHKVFYSACQAIMYILCFRMRSWMSIPWRKIQLHEQLESILKHKLSPLKVCLPSVVKEFLKQARVVSLVSASESFNNDDVVESEFSRSFGGMNRLDMFFPFDPCLLKKSNSFIGPNFIYWSAVRNMYSDDEHGNSSYEDPADNDVDRNGEDMMAESYDDLDDFDSMLNKMSITPKNSLAHKFGAVRMPSRIRPSTSPESL